MKQKIKEKKGITLIALVVTIVVLLILAGISLNIVLGQNGIIQKAKDAKIKQEQADLKEKIDLEMMGEQIDSLVGSEHINGGNSFLDKNIVGLNKIEDFYDSEYNFLGREINGVINDNGKLFKIVIKDKDIIEIGEKISEVNEADVAFKNFILDGEAIENEKTFYDYNGNQYMITSKFDEALLKETLTCKKVEIPKLKTVRISNTFGIGGIDEQNGTWFYGLDINESNIRDLYIEGDDFASDMYQICLIDNSGKVYGLSVDENGNITNRTNYSDLPGSQLSGKNIVEILTCHNTYIAIDSDGKLYTWGNNSEYQLGNGTGEDNNTPICISDIADNPLNGKKIKHIEIDENIVAALDETGKVYTWGNNRYGKLGNCSHESSGIPNCISDIPESQLYGKNIVKISIGSMNTCIAIDSDGKVYTWGENKGGSLGVDDSVPNDNPCCLNDMQNSTLKNKKIVDAYIGLKSGMALDIDGKVYTWGSNSYGQLGIGENEINDNIICISDIANNTLNGKKITKIGMGFDYCVVLDDKGKVYIWGRYGGYEPICINDIENDNLKGKIAKDIIVSRSAMGFGVLTNNNELYIKGNVLERGRYVV